MTVNKLIRNGQIINSLSQSFAAGSSGLQAIPDLLRKVIECEMYRHFIVEMMNEEVQFDSFVAFVEADPPSGLGSTVKMLMNLCRDDIDVQRLITLETQKSSQAGGNRNPEGKNQHSEETFEDVFGDEVKFDNIKDDLSEEPHKPRENKPKAPTGTSREYAIRKLEKDHPQLLQDVLEGKKSAHKAMVEAGVRKRQFSVIADDPKAAAVTLVKYYGTTGAKQLVEEMQRLIELPETSAENTPESQE